MHLFGESSELVTAIAAIGAIVVPLAIAYFGWKLEALKLTSNATHTLVNSNMEVQLALNAKLARRLYQVTQDPADRLVAEAAEAAYANHMTKQRVVDKK